MSEAVQGRRGELEDKVEKGREEEKKRGKGKTEDKEM